MLSRHHDRRQQPSLACAGAVAGARTFVQAYERPGTDASILRLAQLGFLPPSDERIRGTASVIARELDRARRSSGQAGSCCPPVISAQMMNTSMAITISDQTG